MPLFGYARVSTRDQDLALQISELTAVGCAKVFKEKASGARSDRPELAKVIGRLEPGDVLVVTRLDRRLCHGEIGALEFHDASLALSRPSFPARGHPSGGLALSPVHTQFP